MCGPPALTSFSQTLVSDLAYAPFGETYAATGSSPDPAFTQGSTESAGQFLSTSLYDFDFRKYAHAQGRWISPDPAGMAAADPTNPQSWNRYAYALNSPLVWVDPLGLFTTAPQPGPVCGNGQVLTLFTNGDMSCQAPCPQGYTWWNGWLICGPPAQIGSFLAEMNGMPGFDPGSPNAGGGGAGCPLAMPAGDYTVGKNAVPLFTPQMATTLSQAFSVLNSQGIVPDISSGFRTPADQLRMLNGGSGPNPAAKVSWHQVGMAVDINGTGGSNFQSVINAMTNLGLTWGGTFVHPKPDPPHFQQARPGTSPSTTQLNNCKG